MTPKTVAILVTHAFDETSGSFVPGGRDRIVKDLAELFASSGAYVDIYQKGTCNSTITYKPRIVIHSFQMAQGHITDLIFALRTRRAIRHATLTCYATPEDGFPFYSRKAFAFQHGIFWDGPRTDMRSAIIKHLQYVINATMCRRVDSIVCVDTAFGNYLRLHGSRGHAMARKCYYMPNYVVVPDDYMLDDSKIRRRFEKRNVLFLRRFAENRAPEMFLRACALLRAAGVPFSARMVGWGPKMSEIQSLRTKLRLEDSVEVSSCSLQGGLAVVDDSTISVVPSTYSEGTSFSAIESIALGVPVVVSDVGGLGNLVIPHYNGYICNASPERLAQHLERLLGDYSLYSTMAWHCFGMRAAFSFDRWANDLVQHLKFTGSIDGAWASEFPIRTV
jgi:glycosyltransferase involved in cell wall biosynthesis